jgi:hypothetical protein
MLCKVCWWGGVGRMLLTEVSHKRQEFVKKKRVKFNNRFVVAGTQQLDSTVKVLKKWKLIAFAKKNKSHGGTNENRWKWARSFQWRHNASITSLITISKLFFPA